MSQPQHSVDDAFVGFTPQSYGRGLADVYDEWYGEITDVDATVGLLRSLAVGRELLELGVGTGRIAVPLAMADRSLQVSGIDVSAEMLAVLAERDPERLVTPIEGDMVTELPDGPFGLVAVLYNTILNLTHPDAHAELFRAVANRLIPGGRFVVEAFVPGESPTVDGAIELRSMTADRVVLSVSRYDASQRRADGQFIEFTESGGVRLRPWSIRHRGVNELDELARAAGLNLEHRWEDVTQQAFTDDSPRHVSVYRRPS